MFWTRTIACLLTTAFVGFGSVAGVVSRSDIVLEKPNTKASEAMPLGNGTLGAAVWAEGGLRLQVNRADTLPGRLSPGQIVFPGLQTMMASPDFGGRLDLHKAELREHGGKLATTVYIDANTDAVVVMVSGADPDSEQSASLYLWSPRKPEIGLDGASGFLAETWIDATADGATHQTFGSFAAITADARDVKATRDGDLTVKLSFHPKSDGSFRVLIASPEWRGGDTRAEERKVLAEARKASAAAHQRWWSEFWDRAGLMKLSSPDGAAEYFENLRLIDLYAAAAERGERFPGSQAGVADLFSSMRDKHQWDPSAFWHWNLRMQVAANLGAGLPDLNEPYFRLYRDNLRNMEAWTRATMSGRGGVCVPETMRFNGAGYENETWTAAAMDCAADFKPYYNARTITTGAEISLWVWQQYLITDNLRFLAANFPLMADSARFLLEYSNAGADGKIHTAPSNAHETQWDVHDPTTDIAAMKALYPVVIQAADLLGKEKELVSQLKSAIPKLLEFPHDGDVIAASYEPRAEIHNTENIGLEPVWPYALIGDRGPMHDIAVRTYLQRPNKFENDWSYDPVHAARLGLADEVERGLKELTEKYQAYPSGLAHFVEDEFYGEQIGVLASALEEALVQDYDGLIRMAPAWPKDWDADGTVAIQHKVRLRVAVRNGRPKVAMILAGAKGELRVRNPWPGQKVEFVSRGKTVIREGDELLLAAASGESYLVRPLGSKVDFDVLDGSAAQHARTLGTRHIGIQ